MRYIAQTRAHNVGGGWRRFRIVEADNPIEACEKAVEESLPRTCFNHSADGTPEKPFLIWNGVSDMCAIPEHPDDSYEPLYLW